MMRGWLTPDLAASAYPSPDEARAEVSDLASRFPSLVERREIGRSSEDRPLEAFRLRAPGRPGGGPALLVSAHIHAVEFVGSYVARRVMRLLLEGYGSDADATRLLDESDVWIVPLLNPDGAERVWRRRGRSGLGQARFTARGVDPNRNFPFDPVPGRGGWNSGRSKPGSPWYRGPKPLSEPECAALARLAAECRFAAAINFHSFGCVVYMPEPAGDDAERAARAFAVFDGPFQERQRHRRYRPVPEKHAAIVGQLDAFLYGAFGTISVTVEVSRPGWHVLSPRRLLNVFWVSNPPDPERWADNDAPATVAALLELLDRTGGRPCTPTDPHLADRIPPSPHP
ncbi:MAG: M14 family zinc carboxypeptidase [Myxococcota bacterium]